MVFHWSLSYSMSFQISRTLNRFEQCYGLDGLDSFFNLQFPRFVGTVPIVLTTFIFRNFFFLLFGNILTFFHFRSAGTAKFTNSFFLFIYTRSGFWFGLSEPFLSQKYMSFLSRTHSGLLIYTIYQISVFCTISNISHFPLSRVCSCMPFVHVCCNLLSCE